MNIRILLSLLLVTGLLFSCKKETVDVKVNQQNEDNSNMKSEADNINNDVNNVLNEVSGFKKNGQSYKTEICGATIDSSLAKSATPTLVINFDGTTKCGSPIRIRSGSIKVELIKGKKWSEKDAQLRITHLNYKVTFPEHDNQSLTFNGSKILTNLDGFNWIDILTKGTLKFKYTERGDNLSVTFDNGEKSTWSISRKIEWTYTASSNSVSVLVDGDSTSGTKKIDSWGVNRYNENFTTYVAQPWESNTICGGWRPVKGMYEVVTPSFTFNIVFGVNSAGTQVTSGCAYGLSITWNLISTKQTGTAIVKYW